MPKSKVLAPLSFLSTLANQKEGFRFGEPQRIDEKSLCVILPILRESTLKRQYILFQETDKVDITDSGNISIMKASSVATDNVFIRSGTIFKGATQERTSVRSAILFPGGTLDLEVRCVHASRDISKNAKVTYGGITPLEVENSVYCQGFKPTEQFRFWKSVSETSGVYAMTSSAYGRSTPVVGGRMTTSVRVNDAPVNPTFTNTVDPPLSRSYMFLQQAEISLPNQDDLLSNLNQFSQNFDDLLSKIKPNEKQAGMALINEKGCQTIETFDLPDSWQALHKDAVKRVGAHVVNLDDSSVFAYKPEKAIEVVTSVLAQDYDQNLIYEHKPSNGEPSVTIRGLTSKEFVGEVVELDNRVIHLLLLKRAM